MNIPKMLFAVYMLDICTLIDNKGKSTSYHNIEAWFEIFRTILEDY